jgi:glutaryl-CoA transferase
MSGDRRPPPSKIQHGPLTGTFVLDMTRNLAGPFCTMILGDLGAEVVKVESPGAGDDTRSWAPPEWNGVGATFLSANRNKRSIAVDIDRAEGVEIVRRLSAKADVLVESFRAGSLDKRGLGYRDVKLQNERIVYCSITAFGDRGPMRERPGYDPVLQAATGIMALTGAPDGPPVRLGIGAVDLGTALWATIAIEAALAERDRHGAGAHIATSLYEVSAWWLSYHIAGFLGSGVVPQRQGSGTPFIAPYEVFQTGDGELYIGIGNDRLFRSLAEMLERPELATDPRFATNGNRVRNRDLLRTLVTDCLAGASASEWEGRLSERSIPCSRIRSVADLVDDEQLSSLGLMTQFAHPRIPDLRLVDLPVAVDGRRAVQRRGPPDLGQDTEAVLSELGYTSRQVRRLRRSGVIR